MRIATAALDGVAPNEDIAILNVSDTYYVFQTDILWAAEAEIGVSRSQPRTVSVQSNGVSSSTLSGAITATTIGGSNIRAGVVADPDDATKQCWYLRADSSDSDTSGSGAKRSEILPSTDCEAQNMFMDRRYVIGLCERVADWTVTTDVQVTWQLHDPGSLPPWLAHYVEGNTERIDMRYKLTGDTVLVNLWSKIDWTPNTWRRWVIDVVESQTSGVVRVFADGVQIINYSGPVGYAEPNGRGSYWKNGVYHWTDSGNTWDSSLSMREVWQKGAYISKTMAAGEMEQMLRDL
jgi:hypothetical protein